MARSSGLGVAWMSEGREREREREGERERERDRGRERVRERERVLIYEHNFVIPDDSTN